MSADTYEVLVGQITAAMQPLSQPEAKELAVELVQLVNTSLAGADDFMPSAAAATLLPPSMRTPGALLAPWDAYHRVHEPDIGIARPYPAADLLCTLPASIRNEASARRLAHDQGIWAGSLMTRVHELINAAEETLYLVCPYWSELGVGNLMKHITRATMTGVRVVVLTRPRESMDDDDLRGIITLRQELERRGASVLVKAPDRDRQGRSPLVHAKVVIRDGAEAYLGSANFSMSGMESSVEVGVLMDGQLASRLQAWAEALEGVFVPWTA